MLAAILDRSDPQNGVKVVWPDDMLVELDRWVVLREFANGVTKNQAEPAQRGSSLRDPPKESRSTMCNESDEVGARLTIDGVRQPAPSARWKTLLMRHPARVT